MPTKAELIYEVRHLLDEPIAAQWQDDALCIWLNEANRDLARSTRHYKSTSTIIPVVGLAEYTVDPAIIAIEHCYYFDGSRNLPLTPRHYENMDQVWGERRDDATGAYPAFYTTWGNQPNLRLRFYPVPSNTAPHEIRLLTAVLPEPISLTGDETSDVDVPPAWYDALADYCEYKALRRDRDPRWQEARTAYMETRDALINNPDYLPVAREMVPVPNIGHMPLWLIEPEGW